MKDALFLADSVGVAFGSRTVLNAATFWAVPGRITLVSGRNGSGKTTLIRAALGVGPIHYGMVRYRGEITLRPDLGSLARNGLYYLPSEASLGRGETLRWHLKVLRSEFSIPGDDSPLDALGLAPFLDHTPHRMSGGEERKAELATAFLRRPRCLIADEPLNGIAPKDQDVVAKGLRSLAEGGTAVLITGHEILALLELADEVIWLSGGTTHGLGSPAQAREHHEFKRDYLGVSAESETGRGSHA